MFSISELIHDTFINGLVHISSSFDISADPPYYYGTTAQGARLTLAMNVRRGRLIGHPSSIYAWDIISVVEHCFPDAGIQANLYVGRGYANQARSTSAQRTRRLPDFVELVPMDGPDRTLEGNLLVAHAEGKWITASSTENIDPNYDQMPFGPVILDIQSMDAPRWNFPRGTLRYIIDTIEKGEEPMEVEGRYHLNAVSGWKAFARWMQSFTVPLPQIRHEFIQNIPELLLVRRSNMVAYLEKLQQHLEAREQELIHNLAVQYRNTLLPIQKLFNEETSLDLVRSAYFAEQGTQIVYKKLDTYLTHES